jgi:hypothetical protein
MGTPTINVQPQPQAAPRSVSPRFTRDGNDALEAALARLCHEVLQGVHSIIPASRLDGLVLGGGYGRGEGGVLKTETGEAPYNDLEFYVFVRGNRWRNERRYGAALHALAERLSPAAGLHVEFKCDSLRKLRRSSISMFTYDLVARHRILSGDERLFEGCLQHSLAATLPLAEASRLLLNRCTGLLLAKELLQSPPLTAEQADFIGRNLAKAKLALGDAVLTTFGLYHWSCLERHQRLTRLASAFPDPQLAALSTQLVQHHAAGVDFKLHPCKLQKSVAEFQQEHRDLSLLAAQLWLWLENSRLHGSFASVEDYARSRARKCPDLPVWRNPLLNLRTFGIKGALGAMGCRYPRERLFNTLPLLLWCGDLPGGSSTVRFLQRQLHTGASQWADLVSAYKQVWPGYA